jgi:hypothetical protein
LSSQVSCTARICRGLSQGLQEIDDRVDFLLSQNTVAPERRHDGLRIAFGFIGKDRDQLVTVGIFAFDIPQHGPDSPGKIAPSDLVASQAITLAAIESQSLTFGDRLRARRREWRDRAGHEQQGEYPKCCR